MWQILSRKTQVFLIVAATLLGSWAITSTTSLITGSPLTGLRLASLITTVIVVGFAGLAELLWRPLWERFPMLQIKVFPDLNGIWNGVLLSTWVDPVTGAGVPPIPAKFTIRQGVFSVSVTLETAESKSYSTRVFLEHFAERRSFRIWYSYNNDPQAQHQHRSSPHEGVAFLEMDFEADPGRLAGRYYTARKTTGDMELQRAT